MDSESENQSVLTRRRFLRLGLALPMAMATISIPVELLAAIPEKKPRAPRLLMIDPGHGGHDPGAIGLSGTQEKHVTLDIGRHMANAIAGQRDMNAKLTRDEDIFLPLQERVAISRSARADLFVSIHADSAPNTEARGLSAYTLSEKASDEFSGRLAKQENHADSLGGLDLPQADPEVSAILFDLTARRTRNTSQRVKTGFVQGMGRTWPLLERPMRAANFAVLRSPDVPSILIETGFLSNAHDEKILMQSKQREKIAQIMAKELARLLSSPLFG